MTQYCTCNVLNNSTYSKVEALLTDNFVTGQLYLRRLDKIHLNSHTNSVFTHSCKWSHVYMYLYTFKGYNLDFSFFVVLSSCIADTPKENPRILLANY